MAILKQSPDNVTIYTGWYGDCSADCSGYDLAPESIRDIISLVFIVNGDHNVDIRFDGEIDPDFDDFFQDFTSLECGRIYRIELRPGDGEIDIPGFVVSTSDSPGEGRVTTDCAGSTISPTPTPTLLPGQTPFPTATATPTPTPTPTPTLLPGQTPFPTATPSPTPTATAAPTPTPTLLPGQTPYPTATPLPTPTATATATPAPSPTPTLTYATGQGDVYEICYPDGGYIYELCEPYKLGEGNVYTLCDTSFLSTDCRVYRRCVNDDSTTSTTICGTQGRINARFQAGSGFYKEGGVANIAIIREDLSLDDEFTVEYATNSITADNTDYKPVKGTVRFNKGQNFRYINIPILTDTVADNNNVFQVILTNMQSVNINAVVDITLADHTGIIIDNNSPDLHESVNVDSSSEDCGCPDTPLDEITIPWSDENPPVLRYKDTCYYRTTICRCGDLCTSYEALQTFETCGDCDGSTGIVYKLCGDVYTLCGNTYEICDDTYYWQNQSLVWDNIGPASCD